MQKSELTQDRCNCKAVHISSTSAEAMSSAECESGACRRAISASAIARLIYVSTMDGIDTWPTPSARPLVLRMLDRALFNG